MARWVLRYDAVADALVGSRYEREPGPVDIVPALPCIDFVVDRTRPEELVGFIVGSFGRPSESEGDFRLFGELVGRDLGAAVTHGSWLCRRGEPELEWVTQLDLEDDPMRARRRLRFLFGVVNVRGWASQGEEAIMTDGFHMEEAIGPVDVARERVSVAEEIVRRLIEGGTKGSAASRIQGLHNS